MIWIVFAVLTLAAAMSVLGPLARGRSQAPGLSQRQADVVFYDAEQAGIARDLARGAIDEREAELARAEAARRLIASADAAAPETQSGPWPRRIAALASILVIAVSSLGLYGMVGAPSFRDQPLLARTNAPPEQMDVMAAVAKIEAHLAKAPKDGVGREIIAPVYMRLGRYDDAVRVLGEAIVILGPSPERETALGEALTMGAAGKVTPQALAAFDRALKLSPTFSQARFYVGLAAEQGGDKSRAAEVWSALLADAPPGAPWAPMLRERLGRLGVAPPKALEGPQSEAGAAIAALPDAERAQAIRGMVDSLAARLDSGEGGAPEWARLVRAYVVLNEPAKAASTLAKARSALAGDKAALAGLDDLARELGLGG